MLEGRHRQDRGHPGPASRSGPRAARRCGRRQRGGRRRRPGRAARRGGRPGRGGTRHRPAGRRTIGDRRAGRLLPGQPEHRVRLRARSTGPGSGHAGRRPAPAARSRAYAGSSGCAVPAYPSARHHAAPASLPGPDRAAGRRPTAESPSPSGPGRSGRGGRARPDPGASNDHPPPSGRRVIDGPAVNASTDTASSRLRTRSSTRCDPFTTTASTSRSPSGSGTVRRRCRAPPSAPRTTSQVPGAPPPAGQECSSARAVRTISACCAPISSRSVDPVSVRGGGPGVEHHAAVDVDQGCGDDSHVTQQWSEHDGDAVGPDVHHVAVASHEAPRSPLRATRGRSAVTGGRREERLVVTATARARRRVAHEELLLDDPQVAPRHREVRLGLVEHEVQEQLLVR